MPKHEACQSEMTRIDGATDRWVWDCPECGEVCRCAVEEGHLCDECQETQRTLDAYAAKEQEQKERARKEQRQLDETQEKPTKGVTIVIIDEVDEEPLLPPDEMAPPARWN